VSRFKLKCHCAFLCPHTWWDALPVQLSDLRQKAIIHVLHKAWYAVEGAVTGLIQLGPAQQAAHAVSDMLSIAGQRCVCAPVSAPQATSTGVLVEAIAEKELPVVT
jgi:hypothetical protein